MPNYRRRYVPGGTYFFTVNLRDRRSRLLVDHIDNLRAAYKYACGRHPFETIAICILPEHLHCLWSLPEGDDDFSTRWRLIKTEFSRALPKEIGAELVRAKGERGVWQQRFWEHKIRNEKDFHAHVSYIHWNPIKHGHAVNADHWPYWTWHGYKAEFQGQIEAFNARIEAGEP